MRMRFRGPAHPAKTKVPCVLASKRRPTKTARSTAISNGSNPSGWDRFPLGLRRVFFDIMSTDFVGHPRTPMAPQGTRKDPRPNCQRRLLAC